MMGKEDKLLSFWDGIFSGTMLNFQGVIMILMIGYQLDDAFQIHDITRNGCKKSPNFHSLEKHGNFRVPGKVWEGEQQKL